MYPAPFEYTAPRSLDEALAHVGRGGRGGPGPRRRPEPHPHDEAPARRAGTPGGHQPYPRRSTRSAIDNGHLTVGALVRHAHMVDSDLVAAHSSLMASAAPWISDPLVRNRGTLCGSVAHCDPEGDWNSVMLALGATVIARSAGGERRIPIAEFVIDFFTNSLQPGEMVVGCGGAKGWSPVGWQLPQAGAKDRRLRHRGSGDPDRPRRWRESRLCRVGAHQRRVDQRRRWPTPRR